MMQPPLAELSSEFTTRGREARGLFALSTSGRTFRENYAFKTALSCEGDGFTATSAQQLLRLGNGISASSQTANDHGKEDGHDPKKTTAQSPKSDTAYGKE